MMPIGRQAICQPPFNEPSSGLVFQVRRPTVLYSRHFGLRKIDDSDVHCLSLVADDYWKLPNVESDRRESFVLPGISSGHEDCYTALAARLRFNVLSISLTMARS